MEAPKKVRDASIDRLRGLSVFLMLGANIAPVAVPEPRPFLYRALSTVCAPTFVLLAGMMLGKRPPSTKDAFVRGGLLFLLGGVLDGAAWGLFPFVGFDILYLLGAMTPLVALASRLEAKRIVLLALVVLFAAKLGREAHLFADAPALGNALFDGWFPLFPWLSLALFGAALGKLEREAAPSERLRAGAAGVFLVFLGAVEWSLSSVTLRERGGYAELFYPPEHFVLGVFVGGALLLRELLRRLPLRGAFWIFEAFGRRSLFVYLTHILIIGRVLHPLGREASWGFAIVSFLVLFAVTSLSVWLLDRVRVSPLGLLGRTILGSAPSFGNAPRATNAV